MCITAWSGSWMGEGYLCGMESGYEVAVIFCDHILHTIRKWHQSYQVSDGTHVQYKLSAITWSHHCKLTYSLLLLLMLIYQLYQLSEDVHFQLGDIEEVYNWIMCHTYQHWYYRMLNLMKARISVLLHHVHLRGVSWLVKCCYGDVITMAT